MRPKNSKMQATKQKAVGPKISGGGVTRVKTEGRIGSPTPSRSLSKSMDINTNSSAQPHSGGLAGAAAKHMSPSHSGGVWTDRAAKARALAATPRKDNYHQPINAQKYTLHKVKPA